MASCRRTRAAIRRTECLRADGSTIDRRARRLRSDLCKASPPVAEAFAPRWSVWPRLRRARRPTDGNATLGPTPRPAGLWHRGRRRLPLLAYTIAGLRWPAAAPIFDRQWMGSAVPTCSRPAPSFGTTVGPAISRRRWPMVAGHHTDRTVTIAGSDQLRAKFNANAWSGG